MIYFHQYLIRALKNPKAWKKGVYRRDGPVGDYRFLKRSYEYQQHVKRVEQLAKERVIK